MNIQAIRAYSASGRNNASGSKQDLSGHKHSLAFGGSLPVETVAILSQKQPQLLEYYRAVVNVVNMLRKVTMDPPLDPLFKGSYMPISSTRGRIPLESNALILEMDTDKFPYRLLTPLGEMKLDNKIILFLYDRMIPELKSVLGLKPMLERGKIADGVHPGPYYFITKGKGSTRFNTFTAEQTKEFASNGSLYSSEKLPISFVHELGQRGVPVQGTPLGWKY